MAILVFLVLVFANLRSDDPLNQKATVKVWGFDDPKNLVGVFSSYKKIRPNVTIEYTRVGEVDYEKKLLEAFSLQKGPDVFVVDNNSLLRWKEHAVPVADSKLFNLGKIKNLFPQVVEQDFVSGGRIYALPYSIDTLVLVYNRDFFDEAGIIDPPKTWESFQVYSQALRRLNNFGAIVRAGGALGGTDESISQAADILNWLLMQNGGITYERESLGVNFDFKARGKAQKALAFYLQFSDPKSPYYSWTGNQGTSIKSFADRGTAMIFAYKKDLEAIKKMNAFLDFGVALGPQIQGDEGAISYANYTGFAVSRQSKVQNWAWDFIVNTATDEIAQDGYMRATKNPPALRALIGKLVNDSEMGIFTRQALIARSWPQVDGGKVREILNKSIKDAKYGSISYDKVLKEAYDEIVKLLKSFKIKTNG